MLDEQLFMYVEDVELVACESAAPASPSSSSRTPACATRAPARRGGRASTTNLYYDTRNTIVVAERYARLPRGVRALRRGAVVGAHLVQAARHPNRGAAARAVIAGWRDARAGRLGRRAVG